MTETQTEQVTTKTNAEPDKTFTQAEVDSIVLKRAERVAADKYSDYGELQAKAKQLSQLEQASATDLEKAVAKARSEAQSEVRQETNAKLVAAEARAIAAEVKFRNPKLVIRALDLSGVKVADDGTIDDGAIRSLLTELAKDEPYLLDDGKVRPKPDPGQGRPQGTPSKAEDGRAEARKRFGTPAGQTTT